MTTKYTRLHKVVRKNPLCNPVYFVVNPKLTTQT
jgi:hypothetical protein